MPSKLDQLQQQFRQRIDQRKEENLSSIRLYNENQQRVLERVSKNQVPPVSDPSGSKPTMSRRNGSGVDRSRPLKPLVSRPPFLPSQSTESSTARGSSIKVRPNTTGSRAPVPQTKIEVQKTGAGNTRILSKSNYTATKQAALSDPKVVSVTTTTTSFRMEKKTGTASNGSRSASNGSRSAPSALKSSNPAVKPTSETRPPSKSSVKSLMAFKAAPKAASTKVTTATPSAASSTAKPPAKTAPQRVTSAPLDPNMSQCSICGRTFAKDRIEKHASICQKTTNKKRKVYDATKMRTKGTEAEQFLKKGAKKTELKSVKTNWRLQHETFISTIRQAKAVQRHLDAGGKLSDLPPPPRSENPDYVPCPHCGRKFDSGVAERHIPKCKTIASNKKAPPKNK